MADGKITSLTGKALSAFLSILRANGVSEYPTEHGVIKLAPRPVRGAPLETSPEDGKTPPPEDEDEDLPPEGDFRFGLERRERANFTVQREKAIAAARERRAKSGGVS